MQPRPTSQHFVNPTNLASHCNSILGSPNARNPRMGQGSTFWTEEEFAADLVNVGEMDVLKDHGISYC